MASLLSLMEGLSLVIKQLPQKALPAQGPVAQLVPPNTLRVWQGPCCVLMDPWDLSLRVEKDSHPPPEVGNAGEGQAPSASVP